MLKNKTIDRVLGKTRSETDGLDFEILIKEGARVMLTTNISISDRLINGQMYGGPQVSRQFVLKLHYIKFKIAANKNFMVRIKIFVVPQII